MPAPDSSSVVVGVDGSEAALGAVRWAVDEALGRDVPLRLVYATNTALAAAQPPDDHRVDMAFAETSLEAAIDAATTAGAALDVESAIRWGTAEEELIAESAQAALVCVGTVGIDPLARAVCGSTAATVADKAHCTVAVIRQADGSPNDDGWLVTVVDESADADRVLAVALEEARLRRTRVLAVGVWREEAGPARYDYLDRRVAAISERYPQVPVFPIATTTGIARFVAQHRQEGIRMAVIGPADADALPEIIGPPGDVPTSSVLLVR